MKLRIFTFLTLFIVNAPSISQVLDWSPPDVLNCVNLSQLIEKHEKINTFSFNEWSRNPIHPARILINDYKFNISRCSNKDIFLVYQIDSSSVIFKHGFLLKIKDAILYISFTTSDSEEINDLLFNFNQLKSGRTFCVNSISLLDDHLVSLFSVHYKNSIPLYVSKHVGDNLDYKVLLVSEDLNKLKLDPSLKVIYNFKSLLTNEIKFISASVEVPHVNKDFLNYLWLVGDKYQNELFSPYRTGNFSRD